MRQFVNAASSHLRVLLIRSQREKETGLIPTCFIFLPTPTSKTQIFRQQIII